MSALRAGELDRLVTIVAKVAGARDAGGAPSTTWSDRDPSIHARRTDVSDGERMRGGGIASILRTRFLVRAEDAEGVTDQDRIRDEDAGETFDIVGVKRIGFDALEITAGVR